MFCCAPTVRYALFYVLNFLGETRDTTSLKNLMF